MTLRKILLLLAPALLASMLACRGGSETSESPNTGGITPVTDTSGTIPDTSTIPDVDTSNPPGTSGTDPTEFYVNAKPDFLDAFGLQFDFGYFWERMS